MGNPRNVERLVASNEAHARASAHVAQLARVANNNTWYHRGGLGAATGGSITAWEEPSTLNRTDHAALQDRQASSQPRPALAQQMIAANNIVREHRRAKLKELYEREAFLYEEELNGMGLALNKHRD